MSGPAVVRDERNDTAWLAALEAHAQQHGFAVVPSVRMADGQLVGARLSIACNEYTDGLVTFFTWDDDGGNYRRIESTRALRILTDAIRTGDA